MSKLFLDELPESLSRKIDTVVRVLPSSLEIFEELYKYALNENSNDRSEHHKKPRIDDSSDLLKTDEISETNTIFKLEGVSVLSPLRKKLDLVFYLSNVDGSPVITLLKGNDRELSIYQLNKSIKMASFLPVPEKPNLIYLFMTYTSCEDNKFSEPVVMTLNKENTLNQFKKLGLLDSNVTDFEKCVEYIRKQAILTGFKISNPFVNSTLVDTDVEKINSFHLQCHRGTKEGTLYFLPDHIIFGFKKPILLFDASDIESITYSSITRLTFNASLVTKDGEKYEFSMIDQTEYAKIDDYVKRKQMKDKSMSEELKAKSKSKGQATDGTADQPSILQEATRQMQDEKKAGMFSDDDEENDQNFEAESDLSDGSGQESSDGAEDGEEAEEDDEEDDEEEDKKGQSAFNRDNSFASINGQPEQELQYKEFKEPLELEDIPIEIDNDDDEDDEDGSGVEYD
ncbi:HN1_G0010540.mRNA.1.CDS.1 [Saccharomyces cerevisiae]|nr:HN1_G0010540.mRNA.1.CDS.1 [Saccharomyces cerevisiae]CAI4696258.1 BAL_1a_G0044330.mRNA.1.CDS.1 [Saccharomyces cerevisiae]CAI7297613.1 BAL_1a_G0044330.mRNA.1.CDS.1 [Saccharomyces cerevisiae]